MCRHTMFNLFNLLNKSNWLDDIWIPREKQWMSVVLTDEDYSCYANLERHEYVIRQFQLKWSKNGIF